MRKLLNKLVRTFGVHIQSVTKNGVTTDYYVLPFGKTVGIGAHQSRR